MLKFDLQDCSQHEEDKEAHAADKYREWDESS